MSHKIQKQSKETSRSIHKKSKHEEFITPFNERGVVSEVRNSREWKLHEKAFNGTWTQTDKDEIFDKIVGSTYFKDSIALMGVRFNFRPVLKRFWVKTKYGDIAEYYAPNKMSIRNNRYRGNDVSEIKEVM
jgi:lipopolysaccharide biosynthesis glycosyltransferase